MSKKFVVIMAWQYKNRTTPRTETTKNYRTWCWWVATILYKEDHKIKHTYNINAAKIIFWVRSFDGKEKRKQKKITESKREVWLSAGCRLLYMGRLSGFSYREVTKRIKTFVFHLIDKLHVVMKFGIIQIQIGIQPFRIIVVIYRKVLCTQFSNRRG